MNVNVLKCSKKTLFKVVGYFISVIFVLACWITFENVTDFRYRQYTREEPGWLNVQNLVFQNCTRIPRSARGRPWPEEKYLQDEPVHTVLQMASPIASQMKLEGNINVKLGDTVRVKIVLYDALGRRRKIGGDLIRVWMRDVQNNASSSGHVIDHEDGTYSGILMALWEGKPEIRAAIISPREVIATVFKRRYVCPPVLLNTAVFQHPDDPRDLEETPCNYDPEIPGYKKMCNFTLDNYGSPWYCGKPRNSRLTCNDWTRVDNHNLWLENVEQRHLSPVQHDILLSNYHTMMLSDRLTVTVKSAERNVTRIIPSAKCNNVTKDLTWRSASPTGYLYNARWTSRHCSPRDVTDHYASCVNNTNIFMIGDSTLRQFYETLMKMIPCVQENKITSKRKHSTYTCSNSSLNYEVSLSAHPLPFCSSDYPRAYFKTFKSTLEQLEPKTNTIVVIHMYAHVLQYHSHVFRGIVKNMKSGIIDMLNRNPDIRVVLKGPHSFSFSRIEGTTLWMPDNYASVYTQILQEEFRDIYERVIYLDNLDITVSTEQYHIHAHDYVIEAQVRHMFSFICD